MAKKKQNLSPEKLLEQALVPECEWPYRVPENWVWTRLGCLSEVISKGTTPKGGKDSYLSNGVTFLRVENINDDGYINLDNAKYISKETHYGELKRSILESGDILISIAGTLGRTTIVDTLHLPMNTNQALAFIRLNKEMHAYRFYIEKLLSSPSIKSLLLAQTKVTSIPNLTLEIISSCLIPLPPLAEQQRIVDRIESLFEKLDQAKGLIQDALDSFENRKAAILHKAFSGELTKKWREENGVGMESWEEVVLGEYADTKYGYTERAQNENIGPKFLRITDIQDGIVMWETVPYCPISEDDYLKYKLNMGDIVVARTGATTGKSYMIIDDVDAVFASYLIRINITRLDMVSSEFLYKFLQSQLYWNQITELSSGIAQPGVNANKLKSILLPLPSILEQNEIVKVLDIVLEKEIQSRELLEFANNIDYMKKSILARAFRGELGTNDSSEENAKRLFEKMFAEDGGKLK